MIIDFSLQSMKFRGAENNFVLNRFLVFFIYYFVILIIVF